MYVNLFRRGLDLTILAGLFAVALGAQAPAPFLISGSATANQTGNAAALGISSATSGPVRMASDDGRYVLFHTTATNVISGQQDTNAGYDLFLTDRVAGTTVLVSHVPGSTTQTGSAAAGSACLSGDGEWVAFATAATNMVTGVTDTNAQQDLYLYERATGNIALVSSTASNPNQTANHRSISPLLSADGRFIAWNSMASDLVTGQTDTNATNDMFVYDRVLDTTKLVSHTGNQTTAGDGGSYRHAISDDGSVIVYACDATNLISGVTDSNSFTDLICYDISTSANTLITHPAGQPNNTATGACYTAVVSADGAYVMFHHYGSNLVTSQSDTNNNWDVFLWQRSSNTNTLVSHVPSSNSTASTTTTVSGPPFPPPLYIGTLSADGRYATYIHDATDLVTGQSGSGRNVFLFDRVSGTNIVVSRAGGTTSQGVGNADMPWISLDGGLVTWVTTATNVVSGATDTNGGQDVFLFQVATGANHLVSRTAASPSTAANGASTRPGLSGDGAVLWFMSLGTDFGFTDTNAANDLFGTPMGAVVDSVSPTTGSTAGGLTLTVTGVGLSGVTAARLGGAAVTALNVTSDTSLTFTAPAHAAGVVDLELDTAFTTVTAGSAFTYVAPPVLTGANPSTGLTTGGTAVTLTGTGFTGATSVTFGGTSATFTVVSDTTIDCTTPAHAAGAVSVIVTNPVGANGANTAFTYTVPAPTVSGVSPPSGDVAGGYTVTITGTNFVGVTGVTFGGTAATNVVAGSATSLTCTAPSHAAGSVSVEVTTATGTNAPNTLFTYFVPASPPAIEITRNSLTIPNGGADTATGAQAGSGLALNYVIANLGGLDLVLSGPVASANEVNCMVSITQPSTTIGGGNSTPLVVTVTPAASGAFSFELAVASNDTTNSPFDWTVSGTAAPASTSGGGSDKGADGGGCIAAGGSAWVLAWLLPAALLRRRRR
ncbi:MAG: IPT/TIG domain-containing protein [Planctomycetes bacterium]|nr:IPT/TIG domain-containing protein [Planctomycetota bacterium]